MISQVLLLASSSPRRSQLLAEHRIPFEIVVPEASEICDPALPPETLVLLNAQIKARDVSAKYPERLVLAADTVVSFGGRVFGKPRDMAEAVWMLDQLNGREHSVYSGVCLRRQTDLREERFVEITRVLFKTLSPGQKHAYLERIRPLDKAGAYAAQDDRGEIIESVTGSFTNVVGLPMEALLQALGTWGVTAGL
jgi:septum formation protein